MLRYADVSMIELATVTYVETRALKHTWKNKMITGNIGMITFHYFQLKKNKQTKTQMRLTQTCNLEHCSTVVSLCI